MTHSKHNTKYLNWVQVTKWVEEDAGTRFKSEYISPDSLEDLNICLGAAIKLLEAGRTEELDLIDPTGAMSSGDCTPLYAALMVSSFATEARGRTMTQKATNATRRGLLPATPTQKTPTPSLIMKMVRNDPTLLRWGANQLGLTEPEFTEDLARSTKRKVS